MMSETESIYEVRLCRQDEISKVVEFIDTYWKKDHALCRSRELLDFQHRNGDVYNFLIGVNKQTREIDGIWGFIPTSQYDPALLEEGDYWGAISKVRDDVRNAEIKILGYYFWLAYHDLPYMQSACGHGLSEISIKLYHTDKDYRVGITNQYYMLNEAVENFQIARVNGRKEEFHPRSNCSVRDLSLAEITDIPVCHYRPRKTLVYLINRYAKHPVYRYIFWGVYEGEELSGIWVVRRIVVDGLGAVLRVVDVVGDLDRLPDLYEQIQLQLVRQKAEYIDFLNYGIPENVFEKIGFQKLDPDGEIIIPNYFEPFERRNVRLRLACKADFPYILFKGDADQDRPNIIP